MADNKRGRDKQAQDEERRQREREVATALERMDEPKPPIPTEALEDVEAELATLDFPLPAAAIVDAVGDQEIQAPDGTHRVAELVPEAAAETFEGPDAVRERLQRPTVAAAMKRIVEATAGLPETTLEGSQRTAYVKTLTALKTIDAADEDEGVEAIRDWIVAQIEETGKLPGSRAVRRQAATFCRENGYSVQNDEWLGV